MAGGRERRRVGWLIGVCLLLFATLVFAVSTLYAEAANAAGEDKVEAAHPRHSENWVPEAIVNGSGLHTCGLKPDGSVQCWGRNSEGQASNQAGPYIQVSAGLWFSCGLTPEGFAQCWGHLLDVPPAEAFSQISVGSHHVCGVKLNGDVLCWENAHGVFDGPFEHVSVGAFFTCGLKSDGSVDCWGQNEHGQASDQPGPFKQVEAGDYHTCGLTLFGSVDCWGDNSSGQATDQAGPFVQISAGSLHTCGLKPDGSVSCWGENKDGQSASNAGPFVQVSAGDFHTCALATNGSVDCWGYNAYGQAEDQEGPFGPYVGLNDPPVANDLTVTTDINVPVAFKLSASDVDGDPLKYYVGTWPQHGNLAGTPPDLLYTPDVDFYGQDNFRYVANDGKVNSNEATVTITIKPPPPPNILNIRRQYGRYFLQGMSHQNQIEVTVRWPQGNKPQRIEIRRPDGNLLAQITASDIHPGADGVSITATPISMAACPLGTCPLTVVAIGSASSSQPRVGDFFYMVEMPAPLSGNGLRTIVWTPKGSGWVAGQDYGQFSSQMLNIIPELANAEPIMRSALDLADDTHPFRIPSWVPIIGGDYGPDLATLRVTDSATFNTLDSSLQTTISGHLDYRLGNMGGSIPFDLAGHSIYVRDGTFLRFDANRLDFKTGGHRRGADFSLPGIIRLTVDRPYSGHLWAVYRQSENDPLSGAIYAMGAGINTSIESSGSIEALVAKLKATIGGGVGISRSYDVRTQSDVSKADASVYARVSWRVLFWSKSLSKTWTCTIVYSADPVTVTCKESRSAYDLVDWHRVSRILSVASNYTLTANDPTELHWIGDGGHATSELRVLNDVDVDVEPELAVDTSTGDLMVVFTQDKQTSDLSMSYDIAYMRRTNKGWTDPLPIATSPTADVRPDVAYVDGQAVAVWSTLDATSADVLDEPNDAFPHMEIATSAFDSDSETWSTPQILTDNAIFDFDPVVASDGTMALAVWYADPDNEVAIGPEASEEHDMGLQLHFAVWNGVAWSAPAIIAENVDLAGKPALALEEGKGLLAYAVDTDGSAITITDREIVLRRWNGNKWLPPEQLTNDNSEDRVPSVAYFGQVPWVAWVHVNSLEEGYSSYEIASATLDSQMEVTAQQAIVASGQIEELHFAAGGVDKPVLLWRVYGQMASGVNYSVFDPQHEAWSAQRTLIADEADNADYSPLIDANGHLLNTYVKTQMSIEESLVEDSSGDPLLVRLPAPGRSAIYFLDHAIGADLAVSTDDISLSDSQPMPGETIDVAATIRNMGDLTHHDVAVRFIEVASGKVVGNATINEVAAGQTATIHGSWKIPLSAKMPFHLSVVADPDNVVDEWDEANNQADVAIGQPDLAVTLATVEETDARSHILRATIENLGLSSPTSNLAIDFFYNDQPIIADAAYIGQQSISAPAPGESVVVEYGWEAANIAAGDYQLFVVADPDRTIDDPQRANNQLQTAFSHSAGTQPDVFGVSISPVTSWSSAAPGTVATHRIMVTNEGNVSDRFEIVFLDSVWTVAGPARLGPLDPDHSAEVDLAVSVPTNAEGVSETSYLIHSRANGTKSVTGTLITEAMTGVYLPVLFR